MTFLTTHIPHSFDALLHRYSSLWKICRIVAYCLRFVRGSRHARVRKFGRRSIRSTRRFYGTCVRVVQGASFENDIIQLQKQKRVSGELRKLAPFLDSRCLIRVGGRIENSHLSYETKHPALLPIRHRLTRLLIKQVHQENLHPGRCALQYLLMQNGFCIWILWMNAFGF